MLGHRGPYCKGIRYVQSQITKDIQIYRTIDVHRGPRRFKNIKSKNKANLTEIKEMEIAGINEICTVVCRGPCCSGI